MRSIISYHFVSELMNSSRFIMSQQSHNTRATEVNSQFDGWNLPNTMSSNHLNELNITPTFLNLLSELSDADSASALFSAPSGLLTPSLPNLSNLTQVNNLITGLDR